MGGRSIIQITKKVKLILQLTPFLLFIFCIFFTGIISMINGSLGVFAYGNSEYTLNYYTEVLTSQRFYISLLYTIYLGVVPTMISVFIGSLLAIVAHVFKTKKQFAFTVSKLPSVIPYSVYTFIVVLLLMQTGLVSRVLFNLNIIDNANSFPLMIYDKYGIGIILVYALKQVPFVFFIVYAALLKQGSKFIEVSSNLGASTFSTIRFVIIPSIYKSIVTVFLLCFAFNFGSFEVAYMIGSPKYDTLPILAYKYSMSIDLNMRYMSMVINVLMMLFCIVFLTMYIIIDNRKVAKYEKK